jgi:general secretion pathway protein K
MHVTVVSCRGIAPLPQPQSGIALVMVLWMMALLSVIAASLVFSTRAELMIAGNLAALAQAEVLADAGVVKAIMEMARPKTADPLQWKADGLARQWNYRQANLIITIIDESGKIDINTASAPLLTSLFQSVGATDPEALADAVKDWRDADDMRSPRGAEKDDYTAAGKAYGPANAAFETIDELRQVLGMNEELYRRLEHSVTVHSYQAGVNTAVAPREVLLALPEATPEQVDIFIAQRRTLLEQGLPAPPFPLAQGFSAAIAGATFSVQVEAVLGDNTRFLREAVVRLTGGAQQPPTILAWRAPAVAGSPTAAATGIVDSHGPTP